VDTTFYVKKIWSPGIGLTRDWFKEKGDAYTYASGW